MNKKLILLVVVIHFRARTAWYYSRTTNCAMGDLFFNRGRFTEVQKWISPVLPNARPNSVLWFASQSRRSIFSSWQRRRARLLGKALTVAQLLGVCWRKAGVPPVHQHLFSLGKWGKAPPTETFCATLIVNRMSLQEAYWIGSRLVDENALLCWAIGRPLSNKYQQNDNRWNCPIYSWRGSEAALNRGEIHFIEYRV